MVEAAEKDEGLVRDLAEKLKKGELTRKEVKRELKKMGLHHMSLRHILTSLVGFAMLIPIYISTIAKHSKLDALAFFAQLPTIDFPLIVKILTSIFIAVGLFMTAYASHLLSTKGGLGEGDETVVLIKEGPYRVIRHPIAFGIFSLLVLPPIVISGLISYTVLTAIGQIAAIIFLPLGLMEEDEANVKKWETSTGST